MSMQAALNTEQSPTPSAGLSVLHLGHQTILAQAKRNNWLSAGRRWRKTTLGTVIATSAALTGHQILWGAPTYDQVRIAWDMVRRADVAEMTQMRMTADFPGGGRIIFRSLDDPDNARGHGADGAIFDEVGYIKERAYYEMVSPMLAERQDSFFWGMGTPNGRNWFWREFAGAREAGEGSWQVPTVGCRIEDGRLIRVPNPLENPDIAFSEIERLYQTLPNMAFRQEIMAEFLEGEGAVFRNIRACLNAPTNPSPADHEGHYMVAGLDWGRMIDSTAISIGCVDCRQEVALDRFTQVDFATQRMRIKAAVDKWGADILAESNSIGQPNIEALREGGVTVDGFETTATTKAPLIQSLALAFEKQEWQWLPDELAALELEAYEMSVNPITYRPTFGAPEGMHDDTVIARALVVRKSAGGFGW